MEYEINKDKQRAEAGCVLYNYQNKQAFWMTHADHAEYIKRKEKAQEEIFHALLLEKGYLKEIT